MRAHRPRWFHCLAAILTLTFPPVPASAAPPATPSATTIDQAYHTASELLNEASACKNIRCQVAPLSRAYEILAEIKAPLDRTDLIVQQLSAVFHELWKTDKRLEDLDAELDLLVKHRNRWGSEDSAAARSACEHANRGIAEVSLLRADVFYQRGLTRQANERKTAIVDFEAALHSLEGTPGLTAPLARQIVDDLVKNYTLEFLANDRDFGPLDAAEAALLIASKAWTESANDHRTEELAHLQTLRDKVGQLRTPAVKPATLRLIVTPSRALQRGVHIRLTSLRDPPAPPHDWVVSETSEHIEELDPGKWRASLTAPGFEDQALALETRGGELTERHVTLHYERPGPARVTVYAAAGTFALVGAGLLTGGAVLLTNTFTREKRESDACAGETSCIEARLSTLDLHARMSTSAYLHATGAALLGTAIAGTTTLTLQLLARRKDTRRSAIAVVAVGGGLAAGSAIWLGLVNRTISTQLGTCNLPDCAHYARPLSYQTEFRSTLAQDAAASALLGVAAGLLSSGIVELATRAIRKKRSSRARARKDSQ